MRYVRRLLLLVAPVVVLLVGWLNRYNIWDWYRLRGYDPPARIVQLADQTAMTEQARRLFYVHHPELNDKTSFNQNCTISEQSIVLGCYVGGHGIFIYDVTDKRLKGIHHVTAAHELLHAAYDRLSSIERKRIDRLIQDVYGGLKNKRIKETVALYEKRDASVVPNELHSILATEVESLPAELEDYYGRYFSDRQAVVRYAQAYEEVFAARKRQIAAYDQQLRTIKSQIEAIEKSLARQEAELRADRQRMDGLLAAGRYSEYNAAVPSYNAGVRAYNGDVATARSLINEYNRVVVARNAIVVEESELVEAIDSRPDTLPTE